MVTTIIAIYGAVVATVSTLLGVWYFLRSGPSLQAEANVDESVEENGGKWDEDSEVVLRVWNAGRAEVTVSVMALVIKTNNRLHLSYPFWGGVSPDYDPPDLDGPELPIRMPGHSGDTWWISGIDPRFGLNERWTSATLYIMLRVGGRRVVNVPVHDGTYRRIKRRRYVLKPAQKLETQPEVPTPRVVRQQSVRKARNKRSRKR